MSKRPILMTLIYWSVVGLIQLSPFFACGFGAGHDEASYLAITDCRFEAGQYLEIFNFVSVVVYALWAVLTIRSLRKIQNDHALESNV